MIPDSHGYVKLAQDHPTADFPPAYVPSASVSDSPLPSSSSQPYPLHPSLRPVSSRTATFPPPPPATNNISIVHKSSSIKGAYAIDTSVVIPSGLLNPLATPNVLSSLFQTAAQEKLRPNAYFSTSDGTVDVNLYVKGGGTAVIGIENTGYAARGVHLAVAERDPSTTLSLSVISSSSIMIALPSNFRGMIRGGSDRGHLKFSPGLQNSVATFAVDQSAPSQGRYFVGDWTGLSSDSEWKGDTLSVQLNSYTQKNIYIETFEEMCDGVLDAKVRKAIRGTGFKGWIKSVAKAFGTCGKGCGTLFVACFSCHSS